MTQRRPDGNLFRRIADALRFTGPGRSAERSRTLQIEAAQLELARKSGDWRAIPNMIHLLACEDASRRQYRAQVVGEMAAGVPIAELPTLEHRVRDSIGGMSTWGGLTLDWILARSWPAHIWGLFSMHPSGYVRQAAIRHLVADGNPDAALRYALLRLNDWVPQVRSIAEKCTRRFFVPEHAGSWIPLLGIMEQLSRRSRADHEWLFDSLQTLFLLPGVRPQLHHAVRSTDRSVARWAFRAAMRVTDADRCTFTRLAFESSDPVVRLRAAAAVRTWVESSERDVFLEQMATDRFMPVRREALYARLEADEPQRQTHLRRALLDSHPSMRNAARHYLRQDSQDSNSRFDCLAFYVDALDNPQQETLAAAIAGVGEAGTRADVHRIEPFLDHPSVLVAATAVRTLAFLDSAGQTEKLIELLRADRPAVARQAYRALSRCDVEAGVEPIREVARSAPHAFSRRYALQLLLRRRPYDAIIDAIRAAGSDDEVLVRFGVRHIERQNSEKVCYAPSAAAVAEVAEALRSVPNPLPEPLLRRVTSLMGAPLP